MATGRILLLFDRTAVLALGVVAGFAVGLSFDAAGPRRLPGVAPEPRAAPSSPIPDHRAPAGHARPAGDAPEIAAPVDPRVAARVRAAAGEVRVGVFGDSFGDGVWSALYHQLPAKARYRVLRFSKEGTGFTRYRQIDLERRARDQLAGEPIDVAVICFGANDVQPIFADGHLRALLDPGWRKVIGERIAAFVARARSTGAQVYWLGLPAMRDPGMDDDIRAMDDFYRDSLRPLGVPFIDTRAASLDARGGYAAYLPDSRTAEPVLMRANDGVHMSMVGYQRLTTGLAARIRGYASHLRGEPAPVATPPAAATPAATPAVPARPAPRPTATASPAPTPTRAPRRPPADAAGLDELDADIRALPAETAPPTPTSTSRPARPEPDAEADAKEADADARATRRANRRETRTEAARPAPTATPRSSRPTPAPTAKPTRRE